MDNKISIIKKWLGTGSINIFGLPMSGKDTQGIRLAEALGAKFLSSGLIIRAKEAEVGTDYSSSGTLIPTNVFYEWVLPYFEREDLKPYPLILSSIGRWSGEENEVMSVARKSGHEIKTAILLNISQADAESRFEAAKILGDRGERKDDTNLDIFRVRIEEFKEKTVPVLNYYKSHDLLTIVNGNKSRDGVYEEIIEKLYALASKSLSETQI
ncbi:nucleoside monophosphate kinase [Candidatus Saccharibacteria bacterium]|nr:nucleoside monophosphate kinase [Candidatus Saccharibacteria bacterium]